MLELLKQNAQQVLNGLNIKPKKLSRSFGYWLNSC